MELKDKINKIIENTKGKRINKELLYDGGFIKLYKEEYILPDERAVTKESITKNNGKSATIILTRTIDNKYLVVFQNRVNNIVSCEFPSGYIEENEDVLDAALRELKEETGYVSNYAKILDVSMPNIGIEDSNIYIVFIDKAKKEGNQELDCDEFINYELFTFDELEYLINNNYIKSSGNKLAFFYLKNIINK